MGHTNSREFFAFQLKVWATAALAIMVVACSPATVQVVTSPEFRGEGVTPVVILPFQRDFPKDTTRHFQLSNSDITSTATAVVTDLFYKHLGKKTTFFLVPLNKVNATIDAFTLPLLDSDPSYEIARKIGEMLEAKTVLLGRVSQYRDRVGNAFGISQPASVGFEARLVSVLDGITLWEGHFFETQRPMTSDLQGFLKRRRWLTAEELAEDGVKQILDQGWE